ncbi:transcriptional regulator, AsnC family [Shimia gijangensis]|uniref:Transcriptional regulator, AsnC family n=1 Tax=Shimia gijangensis TaxID=1470563 RepID=A0A1M6N2U7_9RHOB|nr:Lrp/AsnC family transcriptional regulator [Shimia gijangensis]SHJ89923.1 transcriptional regulator, AsnC family [Shimia gijangensis]
MNNRSEETDNLRQTAPKSKALDAFDRKILAALSQDATRSYADLGRDVGLSAPAVHERVKRLRATGVIKRTSADLNGPSLGKDFLAFVHVEAAGWGKTEGILELADLPEVEEVHAVTGDTGLILKVRMDCPEAMEGFLWRIYDMPGVRSTRTYVVLSTHLERGVQVGVTPELSQGTNIK